MEQEITMSNLINSSTNKQ